MNWLLLRGLVREQRHWDDFPERFRAVLPDAKTFCLDFPGIGTEVDRASPWDIPGIMRDVRSRWRFLKESHEGPWGLLSISLGSMVGLEWSQESPEDFSRIVVINTSSSDCSGPLERLLPSALGDFGRFVGRRDLVAKEAAILDMVSNLRTDRQRLAEDWASYSPSIGKRLETFSRQISAALRFRLPASVPVPLLVLSSAQDHMVSPACSAAIAKRLGAPIRVHETAGHDLPLDDGTWVAEQVRDWLRAL